MCRGSDGRRILIAVKKNPRKEALAQVVELANHKANKNVYIGKATQRFRDQFETFRSKVEFWSERELESRLNESSLTLRPKIANAKANEAMLTIMKHICIITNKSIGRKTNRPSIEALETLWGMKDRAVTIYNCARMTQLMLEDPSRFGQPSHEQVQKLVVYVLDYIYGLLSLQKACHNYDDPFASYILSSPSL